MNWKFSEGAFSWFCFLDFLLLKLAADCFVWFKMLMFWLRGFLVEKTVEFVDLDITSSRDLLRRGTTSFSATIYSYWIRWKFILPLTLERPFEVASFDRLSLYYDRLEGVIFLIRFMLKRASEKLPLLVWFSGFYLRIPVDFESLVIS